jgi:lipoprotein-anchoring transpeptidase ErfK/SrfK
MNKIAKLIVVHAKTQLLEYIEHGKLVSCYKISTAANGLGELQDSEKTPRGWHQVCEKIGENEPRGTVFVGRQKTGEIINPELANTYPTKDWILSRILRLQGLEEGVNLGGNVDSFSRYIYIHGTASETELGQPTSRGCIRMANGDIIKLFEQVDCETKVFIGD